MQGGSCALIKVGDTCELPIIVGELPYTASGNTSELAGDYKISSGGCLGSPQRPDRVQMTSSMPSHQASRATAVTVPTVFDTVVYVVQDCNAMSESCVASDSAMPNSAETFVAYLAANETYYIVVDGNSWNTNLAGDITFKLDTYIPITAHLIAGATAVKTAAADVLVCARPERARPAMRKLTLGDSCESTFVVDALPYCKQRHLGGAV